MGLPERPTWPVSSVWGLGSGANVFSSAGRFLREVVTIWVIVGTTVKEGDLMELTEHLSPYSQSRARGDHGENGSGQ